MKIVITAGGSGGHIYPALELAKELKDQHDILFISCDKKISHKILDEQDFEVINYKLNGFYREKSIKAIMKNIATVFRLIKVYILTFFKLMKFKPDSTIGFGSYITYPVIKIAKLFNSKTFIHEQNSYPGLVNRKLAKSVDNIFYCYEKSLDYFEDNIDKCIYSSNPRIQNITPMKTNGEYILILGGSLGAEKMSEAAVELAKKTNLQIKVVTGINYNKIENKLSNLEIIDYLEDSIEIMNGAKIIITRGGATTLLELVALNKNIIVIPSPNVTANHQYENALELSNKNLVRILEEKFFTIELLEKLINEPFIPGKLEIIRANEIIIKTILGEK